jgi:hypothetical protein
MATKPVRGKPRDKITPAFKKKFLKLLSETGMVNKTCKALNITRQAMYAYKRDPKNKKFDQDWKDAQDMAIELLEDESFRRAFNGLEKSVWYKGQVVGIERVYSDTLLMNRLQAERPDKYQYRAKVEGNLTADLTVKIVKFSDGNKDTK